MRAPRRAHGFAPDPVESGRRSVFLSCRAFLRRTGVHVVGKRSGRLLADQSGSVIVEFCILSVILLMLGAAGVDLANISGYNREIERSTAQIAAVITSCPQSVATANDSCTTDTIRDYRDRKANTLIRLPTVDLSIMQINKVSGAIRVCGGNGTYLDSDIQSRALSVLDDKDVAVVVVMSMTYLPFLPVLTKLYIGTGPKALRGFTIAVQASNAQVC